MRKVLFILGQLSDEDVEWLGKAGQRRVVRAGTVMVEEGKPVQNLYFILDGGMSVVAYGKEVAVLKSGEILGEISFVDSRPASATVSASVDTTVLEIPSEKVRERLRSDTGFAARFYRAVASFLSDRLRHTMAVLNRGPDVEEEELDIDVLDNLHLAGARFDRMLKMLMGT
jgi:CRP-like cAMP-binding protein